MIETFKRNTVYSLLKGYCHMGKDDHSFMEVTEWYSGEGFDITINDGYTEQKFSLTHGQYQLLQVLINYKGEK